MIHLASNAMPPEWSLKTVGHAVVGAGRRSERDTIANMEFVAKTHMSNVCGRRKNKSGRHAQHGPARRSFSHDFSAKATFGSSV